MTGILSTKWCVRVNHMNEYNVVGVVERVLDMKKCEKGSRDI